MLKFAIPVYTGELRFSEGKRVEGPGMPNPEPVFQADQGSIN